MSLTRVDKFYFAAAIFLSFVAILFFKKNMWHEMKIFSLGCLLVAVACVGFINSRTVVHNPARPPLDATSIAFNRVVWPRMTKAYDYFPPEVKTIVTKAEAAKFDEHNNNVYPFLVRMLQKENGKEVIATITFTTLRHFPLHVAAKTAFDFTKYTLPNIAFPLEYMGALPPSAGTAWTVSRMGMFRPRLTKYFLRIGALCFFALLLYSLKTSGARSFLRSVKAAAPAAILLPLAIVVNSTLFTLEAGMDAHIRYALPSYMIILVCLATMFFWHVMYVAQSAAQNCASKP